MKTIQTCLLVTVLCLPLSCGSRKVILPYLEPDDVVVAFGDSLTRGVGADSGRGYPSTLSGLIQRKVINAGISGELSRGGLVRFPDVLENERPALVVLCHGGNDFLQQINSDQTRENLASMVRLAREKNIGVVLLGVPDVGFRLTPPALYASIAKEYGLVYEGRIVGDVLSRLSLKSDQIHPNDQGYLRIAERIAELLKEHGAL